MKEQRFDNNVYMEFFYWLYQSLASSLCFWCVNILYIAAAFLLSIDGRNVFSVIFSLLFFSFSFYIVFFPFLFLVFFFPAIFWTTCLFLVCYFL